MKIRLHDFKSSVGLQLFDRYYAFKQSQDNKKFLTNLQIEFGAPEPNAIHIAFCYFPQQKFCNFDLYDFVFVDNAGESLETCTNYIAETIKHQKVYLICGGFLPDDHKLNAKIIPYNHNIRLFHDAMTRGFYPQYYSRAGHKYNPTKNLAFVNGANRSWRKYFVDLLNQRNLAVDVFSNLGQNILETKECVFEDQYDSNFRNALIEMYPNTQIHDYSYYDNSIRVGIDDKFGKIPPGYFLFDAYYQYHCIIFPETGWINNQHFATEKIYKCFVSGAIPFPVSGAKTHQLYNTHGYQTAWNLLPAELQEFDNELDHLIRYEKITHALDWLNNNCHVFASSAAHEIRTSNKNNFYSNTLDVISVNKLDQILKTSDKYL